MFIVQFLFSCQASVGRIYSGHLTKESKVVCGCMLYCTNLSTVQFKGLHAHESVPYSVTNSGCMRFMCNILSGK